MSEVLQKQVSVDDIFSTLGCTEELTRAYIKLALDDIAIFDAKQHDYGSENIASFGERGVVVRMNDKMARIRRLVWDKPEATPANESVIDSYVDMSVYGVIARLCRMGHWPGVMRTMPEGPQYLYSPAPKTIRTTAQKSVWRARSQVELDSRTPRP